MKYRKKFRNPSPTSPDSEHQPQIYLGVWGSQYAFGIQYRIKYKLINITWVGKGYGYLHVNPTEASDLRISRQTRVKGI